MRACLISMTANLWGRFANAQALTLQVPTSAYILFIYGFVYRRTIVDISKEIQCDLTAFKQINKNLCPTCISKYSHNTRGALIQFKFHHGA